MDKLKAVLIDDEQTIIDGFRKLVDWEAHGFVVTGEANDGIMAVNLIVDTRPDIAIVDINLPLMSGLDVIRKVSSFCVKTSFIIVSGYDQFEYAQEALRLHATDYILKPVDFNTFTVLLDKLRLRLSPNLDMPHEEMPPDERETADTTIQSIIAYLNSNLEKQVNLKQLSKEFYMNPSYLSQFFKNKTGMNYHSYLTMLRINRSKRLLLSSGLSIAEISAEVGFGDYRAFTRAFKKQEGVLPSQYRNPFDGQTL